MRGIEYHRMPRIVHRDNKRYVNQGHKWNDTIGITVRVPSLKRNKKVWKNFYDLFPYIKNFLMSNGNHEFLFGQRVIRVTLKDNVYTVVDERIHGPHSKRVMAGYWSDWTPYYDYVTEPRRRTTKFLKVW